MDAFKVQFFQTEQPFALSRRKEINTTEEAPFQSLLEQMVQQPAVEQHQADGKKKDIIKDIMQELIYLFESMFTGNNEQKPNMPTDLNEHIRNIQPADKQQTIVHAEQAGLKGYPFFHGFQNEKKDLFQGIAAFLIQLAQLDDNRFFQIIEKVEATLRKYGAIGEQMFQTILKAVGASMRIGNEAADHPIMPNETDAQALPKETDHRKNFFQPKANDLPQQIRQAQLVNHAPVRQAEQTINQQQLTESLADFAKTFVGEKQIGQKLENMDQHSQLKNSFVLTLSSYINSEQLPVSNIEGEALSFDMREEFIQKLKDAIKLTRFAQLPNGAQKLTVRLIPEHLGTITLQLVKDGDQMIAKMIASTQSAKDLLEHNIHQLKQALPNIVIQIDRFDILDEDPTFPQDNGRNDHPRQDQERHDQNEQQDEDESFMEKLKEYIHSLV